jgi:hypothetical protein
MGKKWGFKMNALYFCFVVSFIILMFGVRPILVLPREQVRYAIGVTIAHAVLMAFAYLKFN